jgi:hypothetical protein
MSLSICAEQIQPIAMKYAYVQVICKRKSVPLHAMMALGGDKV